VKRVCEGRHESLGLVKNDAHNQDKLRSLKTGNRPTLPQCGNVSSRLVVTERYYSRCSEEIQY